jgi:hypothetical protein
MPADAAAAPSTSVTCSSFPGAGIAFFTFFFFFFFGGGIGALPCRGLLGVALILFAFSEPAPFFYRRRGPSRDQARKEEKR